MKLFLLPLRTDPKHYHDYEDDYENRSEPTILRHTTHRLLSEIGSQRRDQRVQRQRWTRGGLGWVKAAEQTVVAIGEEHFTQLMESCDANPK
jgi:hypothetical protein